MSTPPCPICAPAPHRCPVCLGTTGASWLTPALREARAVRLRATPALWPTLRLNARLDREWAAKRARG